MKLFFATDLHGSERCFRKFVNAARFYGADVLVLGGDLTGKALLPVVRKRDEYRIVWDGREIRLRSGKELSSALALAHSKGFYTWIFSEEELAAAEREGLERFFFAKVAEVLHDWVELLRTLPDEVCPVFWIPGNDDPEFVDSVFASDDRYVVNVHRRVVRLANGYDLFGLGWSTPTPWDTHREKSEKEIEKALRQVRGYGEDKQKLILSIHVPPKGIGLDQVPKLGRDLKVQFRWGQPEIGEAGSLAVRHFIEQEQPALGLFGHVHEGRGFVKIGRTLCINPGSEAEDGILNGVLVQLDQSGVVDFQLTTG